MPNTSPFTGFEDTYGQLSSFLDDIEKAYPTGVTNTAVAYSKGTTGSTNTIKAVAGSLTPEQVNSLSGLKFKDPTSMQSNVTDIVNSLSAAWQEPASDYLHGQSSNGAGNRALLQQRLKAFDLAIQTNGVQAVTPDS